jgi:sigma-B regulation protein RsbU (phosphoserine phosphatase)
MNAGTYGLCETCHDPIEADRLRADPLIRFCLDHLTPGEQRALEQDLDLASRIQSKLLPSHDLQAAGWEAHYHYEPAGLVSGDYCDIVVREGSPGIVFLAGDVSGKGVASSLLMSHLHATFRTLVSVGLPITDMMERANRLFCQSTLSAHYATLVCGLLSENGDVELCNAGHCPPLLLRRGHIFPLEPDGVPLGLFCGSRYKSRSIRLNPGDSVFLYTDGLTEATTRNSAEYGADRLSKTLGRCDGLGPQSVAECVLADLETFRAGARRTDDLTVMVIRRSAERN